MLGRPKRQLEPLGPVELRQREYFARVGAEPETSRRELQHSHVFVGENNLKRSYHQFRQDEHAQYLLAQQLNQPRIRPSGESWTPPKNPSDPDTSMIDAPPARHVHYTPPAGWEPTASTNQPGDRLESILKSRKHPYDNLPYDHNQIPAAFVYDISAYIEETERRDAEAAYKEHSEQDSPETVSAQQRRTWSPISPSRLRIADVGSGARVPLSQPHSSASQAEQISPPRLETLTTPPRKTSSQRSMLVPRPSAIDLYPQLAANPKISNPVAEDPVPESTGPIRRIGGVIFGVVVSIFNAIAGASKTSKEVKSADQVYSTIPKQEVTAVETNSTGRKRRVVQAADTESDTSLLQSTQMVESIPGHFPATEQKVKIEVTRMWASKQENTPPASRPASSESNESASPNDTTPDEEFETSEATAVTSVQFNEHPAEQKRLEHRSYGNYKSTRYRDALHLTEAEKALEAKLAQVKQLGTAAAKIPHETRLPKVNPLPLDVRHPIDRQRRNKERDDGVDALLAKTSRITLESREFNRSFRESRRRKERLSREENQGPHKEEPNFKQQARLEIEKDTIAFRKRAEKEAREEAERQAAEAAEAAAKAAEKDKLIRTLPPVWADKIAAAMSNAKSNPRKVLAKAADGAELTAYDLGRIIPSDAYGAGMDWWLNDEGVNAVMNGIVAARNEQTGFKKPSPRAPEIVAYNSAWLSTYKSKGVHGIKGWSRRMGLQGKLLTAKKVFFPINTGSHWLLLIIRPPDRTIELLDSASNVSPQERKVGHADSIGSGPGGSFFRIAHEWLGMELGDAYLPDEWTHVVGRSEQQLNCDDCGVFTCINALAAAKDRDPSEVIPSNGMIDARRMIVAVLLNGGFRGEWEL